MKTAKELFQNCTSKHGRCKIWDKCIYIYTYIHNYISIYIYTILYYSIYTSFCKRYLYHTYANSQRIHLHRQVSRRLFDFAGLTDSIGGAAKWCQDTVSQVWSQALLGRGPWKTRCVGGFGDVISFEGGRVVLNIG